MPRELRPESDATGRRFCLVAARFNEPYVKRLVDAALDVLRQRGASDADLDVVWVPGSFEVPLAEGFGAIAMAERTFKLLAQHEGMPAAVNGTTQIRAGVIRPEIVIPLSAGRPNSGAERARTGGVLGNRGAEVALAAVHVANLRRALGAA